MHWTHSVRTVRARVENGPIYSPLIPVEDARSDLSGLVGVVIDGLLAEDDEVGALLLGQRGKDLGHGERLKALVRLEKVLRALVLVV